eukprot:SM000008S22358  [mRNA]  locus=s8:1270596:1282650:+ [translate_table: standard]
MSEAYLRAVFNAVNLLYYSVCCSEKFLENLEDHMGRQCIRGHHKTSGSPVCSSNSLIDHRTIVTSRIGENTSRWNLNTLRLIVQRGLALPLSQAAGRATRKKEPRLYTIKDCNLSISSRVASVPTTSRAGDMHYQHFLAYYLGCGPGSSGNRLHNFLLDVIAKKNQDLIVSTADYTENQYKNPKSLTLQIPAREETHGVALKAQKWLHTNPEHNHHQRCHVDVAVSALLILHYKTALPHRDMSRGPHAFSMRPVSVSLAQFQDSMGDHPVLVEFLEKEDEVYAIPNKPTKGHSVYCPIEFRQGVKDNTLQSLHTIPLPAANVLYQEGPRHYGPTLNPSGCHRGATKMQAFGSCCCCKEHLPIFVVDISSREDSKQRRTEALEIMHLFGILGPDWRSPDRLYPQARPFPLTGTLEKEVNGLLELLYLGHLSIDFVLEFLSQFLGGLDSSHEQLCEHWQAVQ